MISFLISEGHGRSLDYHSSKMYSNCCVGDGLLPFLSDWWFLIFLLTVI